MIRLGNALVWTQLSPPERGAFLLSAPPPRCATNRAARRLMQRACAGPFAEWVTASAMALLAGPSLPLRSYFCGRVLSRCGGCRVTNPIKEALTALADALAKRPVEELVFDWFRSGRLVGELSVLIKRRHPEVQAEIDRVYQEHLTKLVKGRDPAAQDD